MITAPPGWFAAYQHERNMPVVLLPLVGWALVEDDDDSEVQYLTSPTHSDDPTTLGFPMVSRLDGRIHYANEVYGFICVAGPGQDAFRMAEHLLAMRKECN